ncbi:hypothetical protein Pcinc_000242 [Petrolisthes cinctipes]|uniref:Uncharacterized protein n=1 Tax=Petrolisthes cinctipes TaxID=88211 RepID=A0AAE1GNL9_PETCI|nr:hypothetical protein Pcinc_000242 [Petrolisthes cinctipes]
MSTVLVNVRYEPFTLPGNDMEAGLLVSLVLFLLQPSQHTEVVIIHDYTLPGVKELVESFSERWAATTILTATPAPDLSQLLVALTSFHTNDLRYMVLLCSANTTWTVFDMVSRHNLESRRVRWLVMGEEPYLADTLLYSVREGSMTATSGIFKAVYDVMDPAISFQQNFIADIKSVAEKNTARIGGRVALEVDAIRYLGNDYHISLGTFNPQSYGVVCPPGAPYTATLNMVLGQLVQSGLVGKWHRDEVVRMKQSSGQGGGVRNIGQGRGTVKPLTLDHLQVLVKVRYEPFTLPGNDMEAGLLVSLVLFLLEPSQHTEVVIIHDYTLPGVKELVESFSERWAATTILTATPAPDLAQLLVALTSFHTNDLRYMVLLCSANTTWTVFDMVSRFNLESRRVRWLVLGEEPFVPDTFLRNLREGSMTATSGIFKAVYDVMDPAISFQQNFIADIKSVAEKNTARIGGRVALEVDAIRYLGNDYHISLGTFNPQSYGVVCPPGAPYTATLNLVLGQLVQSGLVGKWHRDEVVRMKQSSGQGGGVRNIGQGRGTVKPLTLDHLQVLVNVRYEPFTLPGNDMEAGLLVSLVLFLLEPSQHTEVVIIHDYTLPGVKELVESFSERWAATTILTATPAPDLSQLLVALTSFHTNDLRYMVLLCSANTTWTVFDMVSRFNLESRRVRWLVLGEEPFVPDTFLRNLREGSMTATSGIFKAVYDVMDPAISFQQNFIADIKSVAEKNTARIGGRVALEVDAIRYLGNDYHISLGTINPQSYGVVCPPGAPYTATLNLVLGQLVQSGLVGKWHRDEVVRMKQSSGQGGGVRNIGQGRGTVKPLTLDHLQVLVNVRYEPFTLPGNDMEAGLLVSLVLFLLEPSQHTEVVIIHDYTLPGVKELVESFSERWAATTILTATPAPDLSQLLVALTSFQTNDLRYMVLLCSANTTWTVFDMVSRFNLESRRVRWLVLGEEPFVPDTFLRNLREGSMVAEKNTAWIGGIVSLEIHAIRYLKKDYHISLNKFYPQPYGIVCPPGAPYTASLNLVLGRLVQAGLVYKWHRDEVTKLMQSPGQGRTDNQVGEVTSRGQESVAGKPLALDHLQGAFYIAGCGALLAGNVLFTEVITHYFNLPPSRTKSSYYIE